MQKPVMLLILDGWGYREEKTLDNAIEQGNTPNWHYLLDTCPNCLVETSGYDVGLPEGQMGNSEVGHSTIGSGRIIYQSLEKINKSIKDETFYQNKELLNAIKHAKVNNSKLHLIGLLSDGGIHSHINHLFALLDLCQKENFTNVYIHIITDGRDTAPDSGIKYINMLEDKINDIGFGKVATICGRYYMMDRDNRFERVKLAYDMLVSLSGDKYDHPIKAWKNNQARGITDEFLNPSVINRDGVIEDNDSIITFNFRPDRLRELYGCLTNKNFDSFERKVLDNLKVVTMMPVSDDVICENVFSLENVDNSLGTIIAENGLTQLRIAETEKYAHVTYFFDGGVEKDLKNCERILVPSPKVATYDLKPEMSAYEVTEKVLEAIKSEKYDTIILNYANCDMVGHTTVYDAAVKAVEAVDTCIGKVFDAVQAVNGTLIITADHGNADMIFDEEGNPFSAHTTNPVPFLITRKDVELHETGNLGDITPTMLELLGVEQPKEMTGKSMIKSKK